MKKQSLIKGTMVLGFAGIMAKVLGLFFRWPLIMLIGDEGVGYYQMAYPLYVFFVATASGIPVAISKLVSERNAVRDYEGEIQILRKAILLMVTLGGGFSIIMIALSKQIVSFLKWDYKSYYSLIGISIAPVFISVMGAFRGFFQGLQNMNPTAISQVIEQIGRVVVGIGLAYLLLPNGIEHSAGGAAFGTAAGGIFGGIYLICKYFKIKKDLNIKKVKNNVQVMSKLIYTAIPISIGAAIGSAMSVIDSIFVPQKLLEAGFTYRQSTILYGQLTGKAFVLVNVPLTASIALSVSLIPIIAEAYILNRRLEVISKIDTSIRFSMVIALPSFLGLYFLARPVLNLLFPGYAEGYDILKYLSISIPFIVMCQTTTAILQGVGKYMVPIVNLVVGCVVKIIITSILVPIPEINIYGAVLGTIIGYIVSSTLNVRSLKKHLNVTINYYDVMIKPAYASVLMIIAVVFIYSNVYNYTISNTIACLVSVSLGILVYSALVILFGIFKYSYIKNRFFKQ